MQNLEIRAILGNFGMKTLFLLSYFIYLFNVEYLFFNLGFFWPIKHCLGVYFIIGLMLVDY